MFEDQTVYCIDTCSLMHESCKNTYVYVALKHIAESNNHWVVRIHVLTFMVRRRKTHPRKCTSLLDTCRGER